MKKHSALGEQTLALLSKTYTVRIKDIGADAALSKNGMHFDTEAYEIEGIGSLCVMRMRAMLGLMKMETVVLSVTGRDMPLLNLDWVGVMGRETQIAELYDVQLAPYDKDKLAAFQKIADADADLPGRTRSPHWYDAVLYPCSYDKSGKGIGDRLAAAAKAYLETYAAQLAAAPVCDSAVKGKKIREFAETLFAKGGPAVDQVKKLFGDETARRLVVSHMYGVTD